MPLAAALNQPKYDIGDIPVIVGRFTNVAGALATPTTTTFIVVDPAGTQTTTATANAAIVVTATGVLTYTHVATLTVAGMYSWRVKGVGNGVTEAIEGTFEVRPTLVPTP